MCLRVCVCILCVKPRVAGGAKRLGNEDSNDDNNNVGRDASSAQHDTEYRSTHSLEREQARGAEWPSGARVPTTTTTPLALRRLYENKRFLLPLPLPPPQLLLLSLVVVVAVVAAYRLIINQKYFSFN